jgi:hypothetical protein
VAEQAQPLRKESLCPRIFAGRIWQFPLRSEKSGSYKAADFLLDYWWYKELLAGTAENTRQWTQYGLSIAPNEAVMTVISSEAHILRVKRAQDHNVG